MTVFKIRIDTVSIEHKTENMSTATFDDLEISKIVEENLDREGLSIKYPTKFTYGIENGNLFAYGVAD